MSSKDVRQLAREVINKEKWWDMLSRFIDVLRVNIFVVDSHGIVILPPEERRYGGRLLTDQSLKFDLLTDSTNFSEKFEPKGAYLKSNNRYGLNCYAIPIQIDGGQVIAHMIIGPVILNQRQSARSLESQARKYGCKKSELLSELSSVRVISGIMMSSILNLLSEILRDNIELSIKEKELNQLKSTREEGGVSDEFKETAQEIYSTLYLDGLLATLLDIALKITHTECGSVMIKDNEENILTIKASKGLDIESTEKAKIRIGDEIAGIAAFENSSFLIRGTEGNNRIKPFLKRKDIKEALVMPLASKSQVFGVLNIHTKNEGGQIMENLENLKHLSELLSSAV